MAVTSPILPGITPKQRRFVDEYLIDLNATRAAVRAGYTSNNANVVGPRLLQHAGVAAEIAKARAQLAEKMEITRERVLKEVARLAFSDHRKLLNADGSPKLLHELDDDTAAAIAGIEVTERVLPGGDGRTEVVSKIKLWDKNAALDKLCKHLGLTAEKHEHKLQVVDENDQPASPLQLAREITFALALAMRERVAEGDATEGNIHYLDHTPRS